MAAYVAGTVAIAHSSSYHQGLLLVAAVYSILALSLDLVAGATGLYSLGHAGLFALGAYGATILNTHYGWNIFLTLPVCVVGVALVGVVIGALSLRVSGLYFAITTLIFTIIVNVVVSDLSITGGYQGLPSPDFPNFPKALSGLGTALVWGVSGALLLTVVVIWSIRSSALYPALLAIRGSEPFASSVGVRTALTRVGVFSLSAALAGLAGWTFCFLGFITPGQFDSTAAVNILVMVILGGMNTRTGPIFGAVFISLFPVVVNMNPLWQEVLFGAVFIFVIVLFPEGFVGLLARGWRRLVATRRLGQAGTAPRPGLAPPAVTPAAPDGALVRVGSGLQVRDANLLAPPARELPARELLAREVPARGNGAAEATPALEALAISFNYVGGAKALNNVTFVVRRGTVHGLIGPNGSGKSTLVNLLSGELACQAGTIKLHGRRIERLAAWQRADLGMMRTFQTAVMVPELTPRQNVALGLFSRFDRIGPRALVWPMLPSARRDSRRMAAVAELSLAEVGLGAAWVRARLADVPHGVEQLTQLAVACAPKPSVLILDEPLAGLSTGEVEKVSQLVRDLKVKDVTVIVVEHQTRFIFDVCDEVTVLAAGELVTTGTAAQVRADDRVREVYLGQ
ncbi:MAG TPA: ATP-binding cassette domain-containing protein [Acidimicrobiales bacterium]|nr:ATP-binding cassette domain-containing protein [Acidimicrobiales bacterium]